MQGDRLRLDRVRHLRHGTTSGSPARRGGYVGGVDGPGVRPRDRDIRTGGADGALGSTGACAVPVRCRYGAGGGADPGCIRCRFRERAKGAESTVSDIVDRPEEHRFVVTVDGHTAELVYRLRKDAIGPDPHRGARGPRRTGPRWRAGGGGHRPCGPGRPDRRAALPLRPSMAREPPRRGGPGIDRLGARPVVQVNGPERPTPAVTGRTSSILESAAIRSGPPIR